MRNRPVLIGLLLAVLALFIALVAAWSRPVKCELLALDIPRTEAKVAESIPVCLSLRLPWTADVNAVALTASEPRMRVIKRSAASQGFGFGSRTWLLSCDVQVFEAVELRNCTMTLTVPGRDPIAFPLPTLQISGDLMPSDFHEPVLAPESTTASSDSHLPFLLGIGLVLLILVISVVIRTRRPQVPDVGKKALDALQALPTEAGSQDRYYQGLTDILCLYLADAWMINAATMTSREFLIFLESDARLSDRLKDMIRRCFAGLDRVKYAQVTADAGQMEESRSAAEIFILESECERHRRSGC